MKDREYNDQEKQREENNELQKTKDWVSRIPLKTDRNSCAPEINHMYLYMTNTAMFYID
jgi:hypothetical protein